MRQPMIAFVGVGIALGGCVPADQTPDSTALGVGLAHARTVIPEAA